MANRETRIFDAGRLFGYNAFCAHVGAPPWMDSKDFELFGCASKANDCEKVNLQVLMKLAASAASPGGMCMEAKFKSAARAASRTAWEMQGTALPSQSACQALVGALSCKSEANEWLCQQLT